MVRDDTSSLDAMPTAELERMCTDLSISAALAVPGGASQATIERELATVSTVLASRQVPAAKGLRPGLCTMRVERVLSGLPSVGLPGRIPRWGCRGLALTKKKIEVDRVIRRPRLHVTLIILKNA